MCVGDKHMCHLVDKGNHSSFNSYQYEQAHKVIGSREYSFKCMDHNKNSHFFIKTHFLKRKHNSKK